MRILLITYHFAPEKNAGVDRPFSLYKYSQENGIEMDVVTASPNSDGNSMMNVLRFNSTMDWRKRRGKLPVKILSEAKGLFFFDIDRTWKTSACKHFSEKTAHSYDAIYAIYPEASALKCGLELSRILKAPLMVDFTDSIMCDPISRQNLIQKITQRAFEKHIVSRAKAIFTIAQGMTDYLKQTYRGLNVQNVYNGFDPDDFMELEWTTKKERDTAAIKLVHFGGINASRRRDVVPLFEGIADAKRKLNIHRSDIEIAFIGNTTAEEKKLVAKLGIEDIVNFKEYMKKREGLKLIHEGYDFLLLYGTPGERSTVTSKLLEYLKLGKPILGICKNNEAERIINKAGAGEVCDFNAKEVSALLTRAIKGQIQYRPNQEYIESFSRRTQAKTIFDSIRASLQGGW